MTKTFTKPRRAAAAACLLALLMLAPAAQAQSTASSARENLSAVEAAAKRIDAGARLVAITSSMISPEFGFSDSWLYLFMTEGSDQPILVIRQGSNIAAAPAAFGSSVFLRSVLTPDFDIDPLPTDWIDSGDAIDAAERNGGMAFRSGNSGTEVSALLVRLPDALLPAGSGDGMAHAYWIVSYASAARGDYRLFVVDARTGNAIGLAPTTAKQNMAASMQSAVNFAADAMLVQVSTVLPDVNMQGMSALWSYTYYSPSQQLFRRFIVTNGIVVTSGAPDENPPKQPLPANWLDSREAIMAAEASMMNLRSDSVGTFVQAELRRGLFPSDGQRAVWAFTYAPVSGGMTHMVYIDAQTGSAVTVGTESRDETVPEAFVLDQNYPNPFNPETVISYELAAAGRVRLAVYDAVGREVRVLVNEQRTAGRYQVRWDGLNGMGAQAPSGMYFYRITSGGKSQTRTMALVR